MSDDRSALADALYSVFEAAFGLGRDAGLSQDRATRFANGAALGARRSLHWPEPDDPNAPWEAPGEPETDEGQGGRAVRKETDT